MLSPLFWFIKVLNITIIKNSANRNGTTSAGSVLLTGFC
jgi:hypothetical protein